MGRVITWWAKCLFLYFLVAFTAIRYSWVFTTPVWQIATRLHWTQMTQVAYVLSYFLPIFAIAGFLIGLVPFDALGRALGELSRSFLPAAAAPSQPDPTAVPPILWAWVPVAFAFLIRFVTWRSRNASVFDAHQPQGRAERFFGPLHAHTPGLLDQRWVIDRFLFTGPMLFLLACAVAVALRRSFARDRSAPKTSVED